MARIHPTAVVDPSAELGEDVEIGPYCIVGPDVALGDRTRLIANVFIERLTAIGPDCVIYPFATLGTPGQDSSYKGEPTRLEIGARNLIREHASMHRGTVRGKGVTRIGSDGMFMAQSHVAHDCVVGDRVTLGHGATLGGHVTIGDFVVTGGLCAIHQFTRIGRFAFVGGLVPLVADLIPFGAATGHYGRLSGLNMIGLKRRGFSREQIAALRAGVRRLFEDEDRTFQERLADVEQAYSGSPEMMEVIAFVRAEAERPLARPRG